MLNIFKNCYYSLVINSSVYLGTIWNYILNSLLSTYLEYIKYLKYYNYIFSNL